MTTTLSARLRAVTAGLAGLAVAAAAPALADTSTEGTNRLVALHAVDGTQAAAKSYINGSAQVSSRDGRFVAFSTASPLVPEDTNGLTDVYLRDAVEGTTTLVSVSPASSATATASSRPSPAPGTTSPSRPPRPTWSGTATATCSTWSSRTSTRTGSTSSPSATTAARPAGTASSR